MNWILCESIALVWNEKLLHLVQSNIKRTQPLSGYAYKAYREIQSHNYQYLIIITEIY